MMNLEIEQYDAKSIQYMFLMHLTDRYVNCKVPNTVIEKGWR